MKRTVLVTLHILGWVAFVPLAVACYLLSLIVLIAFLAGSFSPGGDWHKVLKVCGVLFALALAALASAIAARKALRRLNERELRARGFEPVIDREPFS